METTKQNHDGHFGLWLGRDAGTNTHLIGTPNGIIRTRSVRRLPVEDSYNKAVLDSLKGTPWAIETGDEAAEQPLPLAAPVPADTTAREATTSASSSTQTAAQPTTATAGESAASSSGPTPPTAGEDADMEPASTEAAGEATTTQRTIAVEDTPTQNVRRRITINRTSQSRSLDKASPSRETA